LKKIRLNLKRGVKTWSFVLYDSAESAYYLKDEPVFNDAVDEEYRRVITLKPGETLEMEWVGSEWVYSDDGIEAAPPSTELQHKFDKVLVGKMIPIDLKDVGGKSGYLELYSGWVSSESVRWSKDDTRKDVRITPIKGKMRSKFDFSKLFPSLLEAEEVEEADSPPQVADVKPLVLN